MNTQEQILDGYNSYIKRLSDGIQSIKSIKAKNKKFAEIQKKCLDDIERLFSDSKAQMEQVMTETVWDKLVIAFFGETNAGKSTIIETFRIKFNDPKRAIAIKENGGKGVDGLIVGDGRQDFTQIYEKYELEIDERPFVLIDVPGIEGKEENYVDEIRSALKQAHCIFYVQGHNKKPDAATAEKIKRYLSDWVDVYSIFNVRGGVGNYDEHEERVSLITSGIKVTQESIKEVFDEVLHGIYKGNVTCQGYLALMSVADFHESREKFISDQSKIISYFGGRENVETFSRFGAITELVRSQSVDFSKHILDANLQKLRSLSKRIYNGIDETIADQTDNLDKFLNQLTKFRSSVSSYKSDTISILNSQLYSEWTEAFSALKESANDIIDSASSEEEWYNRMASRFSRIIQLFETTVRERYNEAYSRFKDKVDIKRKDLDSVVYQNLLLPEVEIDIQIDLSETIEAMKFSLKDDLLKGLIKSVLNPLGTAIKIFTESDDGRDAAKRKIGKELDRVKASVRSQIDEGAAEVASSLRRNETLIKNIVNAEISNIEELKLELIKLKNTFV